MKVVNDICYGEEMENLEVTAVKPLSDGMMLVAFSNGEKRLFDTTTLEGPVFAPLADENVWSHPVLFHGVITWNHGKIDIAPETVYQESVPYKNSALIKQC